MRNRSEILRDRNDLLDRAKGALIGLAIGDSFGDACRVQDNRVNYGFTTDFSNKSTWSTDDTEFAMLTATTLVNCGGELTDECIMDSWLKHVVVQDEFKRGGQSEISAANNIRKGLRAPESGKFNVFHMSDGTAMRIPPVGIISAGNPEKARKLAEIDARISHYRDGIWGAQAVAAAVAVAMADGEWKEIFDAAMDSLPEECWTYHEMIETKRIIEESGFDVLSSWMKIHDETRCSTWATTAEAIPSAFACLRLCHDDFRKGVVLAGNYGRDADTIGAVAGAILGAKYGLKAIPESWVEKTRYPSGTCLQFTKGIDILELAEKLADLV